MIKLIEREVTHVIANKNSQIELLERQIADYKEKLGGLSADQAKAHINALEKNVERFQPFGDLSQKSNAELLPIAVRFASQMRMFELNTSIEKSNVVFRRTGSPEEAQEKARSLTEAGTRVTTEFRNTYLHPALILRDELRSRPGIPCR